MTYNVSSVTALDATPVAANTPAGSFTNLEVNYNLTLDSATPTSLTLFNAGKQLASCTLGSGLSLVGTTLSVVGPAIPLLGANVGDASVTLTTGISAPVQIYSTTLTANRTVTLSTTGAVNGSQFKVVRSGLGAFTLAVGSAKTIPSATAAYVEVTYSGSAWVLTGYGTL